MYAYINNIKNYIYIYIYIYNIYNVHMYYIYVYIYACRSAYEFAHVFVLFIVLECIHVFA